MDAPCTLSGSFSMVYVGQYALAWAGTERFAGLYQSQRVELGGMVIFLQLFGPAE